jgi:GntP family permease
LEQAEIERAKRKPTESLDAYDYFLRGMASLHKWTLTFMQGTGVIINFFPLFLLGGVFGKLMDDSGAALSIARGVTERLGETRAVMATVLEAEWQLPPRRAVKETIDLLIKSLR